MGRDLTGHVDAVLMVVSIHAPAWGATPQHPVRVAHEVVSIHAPAWGATSIHPAASSQTVSFNPRARMGRDWHGYALHLLYYQFQSTRPHGARLAVPTVLPLMIGFNPRARMGRDLASCGLSIHLIVSIHAPAWGATYGRYSPSGSFAFQSTRPHGARRS